MRKRYYVTNTTPLKRQDPACGEEEMELLAWLYKDWAAKWMDTQRAYVNGKRPYGTDYTRNAEERVSYMADYSFDENNEISGVRYDPVPVRNGDRAVRRSKGGTRIRRDGPARYV